MEIRLRSEPVQAGVGRGYVEVLNEIGESPLTIAGEEIDLARTRRAEVEHRLAIDDPHTRIGGVRGDGSEIPLLVTLKDDTGGPIHGAVVGNVHCIAAGLLDDRSAECDRATLVGRYITVGRGTVDRHQPIDVVGVA